MISRQFQASELLKTRDLGPKVNATQLEDASQQLRALLMDVLMYS